MSNHNLNANELADLEVLMGRRGLDNVMRALSYICDDLAVRADNGLAAELASRWNDASIACANMAERPAITRVSE